jgi:uncharacterized protein YjbI with pentapeptide repeats
MYPSHLQSSHVITFLLPRPLKVDDVCAAHESRSAADGPPQSEVDGEDHSVYPPATFKPATFKPATFKPATFKPATFKPATFKPATFKPATFKPATFKPATFKPATFKPATFKPATFKPATFKPATFNPSSPTRFDQGHNRLTHPRQTDIHSLRAQVEIFTNAADIGANL